MNFTEMNWQLVGPAVGVLGVVWAVGLVVLRRALSSEFITRDAFGAVFETSFAKACAPIGERIGKVETQQATAPTREAVKDIERRVEKVELQVTEVQRTVTDVQAGVAGLKVGQEGTHQQLAGVSRQLDMITTHLLTKESA